MCTGAGVTAAAHPTVADGDLGYRSAMAMSIDHVVLWVEDPGRAVDFYVRVVGLAPVRAEEFASGRAPFPSVRIDDGAIFDLVPHAGAAKARAFTGDVAVTAAPAPLNHVCVALDRAGYDALAARLAAAGVATHRTGETNYGARGIAHDWFYFRDPDRNTIEARTYDA